MIDDPTPTSASEPELLPPPADAASRGARRSSADVAARRPAYKGAELDAARGPGLGCFWFQAAVLAIFLVLIPVGVNLNWPFEVLAALLFIVLGLLLFVGVFGWSYVILMPAIARDDLGAEGQDSQRIARLAQQMCNSRAQTPSLAYPERPDSGWEPTRDPLRLRSALSPTRWPSPTLKTPGCRPWASAGC